jgi:small subunit ribosomal protein S2
MTRIPGAVFIIDPAKESIAVAECKKMGVPVVATIDTDCNPEDIDYRIPANDDAIKAIRLLCSTVADAVLEGMSLRKSALEEGGPEVSYPDVSYSEPKAEAEAVVEEEPKVETEAVVEPEVAADAPPEAEAVVEDTKSEES